jgi:hypothetical protein
MYELNDALRETTAPIDNEFLLACIISGLKHDNRYSTAIQDIDCARKSFNFIEAIDFLTAHAVHLGPASSVKWPLS